MFISHISARIFVKHWVAKTSFDYLTHYGGWLTIFTHFLKNRTCEETSRLKTGLLLLLLDLLLSHLLFVFLSLWGRLCTQSLYVYYLVMGFTNVSAVLYLSCYPSWESLLSTELKAQILPLSPTLHLLAPQLEYCVTVWDPHTRKRHFRESQ